MEKLKGKGDAFQNDFFFFQVLSVGACTSLFEMILLVCRNLGALTVGFGKLRISEGSKDPSESTGFRELEVKFKDPKFTPQTKSE